MLAAVKKNGGPTIVKALKADHTAVVGSNGENFGNGGHGGDCYCGLKVARD
jgi:hypothetical protein